MSSSEDIVEGLPTPSRAAVGAQLRRFLISSMPGLRAEIENMPADVRLWDVIGSLSLLELVDYVEQAFDFRVSVLDFVPENFRTIERIARLIVARVGR